MLATNTAKEMLGLCLNRDEPAKPFGEKLYQAIEYLKFRARNCNALEACGTIEKIVSEQQKYRLFQKFFPDEWQKSQESLFKTGYYKNYTERVNEFFGLVNENMFPLLSSWNDDPETEFDNFCIFSLNVDLCCEDVDYEYLCVSYVMALLFFFRHLDQSENEKSNNEDGWKMAFNAKYLADFFSIYNAKRDDQRIIWKFGVSGSQTELKFEGEDQMFSYILVPLKV